MAKKEMTFEYGSSYSPLNYKIWKLHKCDRNSNVQVESHPVCTKPVAYKYVLATEQLLHRSRYRIA